jgi:hypothetical protein
MMMRIVPPALGRAPAAWLPEAWIIIVVTRRKGGSYKARTPPPVSPRRQGGGHGRTPLHSCHLVRDAVERRNEPPSHSDTVGRAR